MLGLYQIYSKNKDQDDNLDLKIFLDIIRSKLAPIQDITADQDAIKDQEFSKKEIASLLQFFIFLAESTDHESEKDIKKDIKKIQILGFFGDDSGEYQTIETLNNISSRIDQLLNFSSEEDKISKELNSSISDLISNHLTKLSEQGSPDQETPSPKKTDLEDIHLTIASTASKSESKSENIDSYIEQYKKIIEEETEFATQLNQEQQNTLSPEKYSGIGASVEMISSENGQITGFKVLSVVDNSHAQDLGLLNSA